MFNWLSNAVSNSNSRSKSLEFSIIGTSPHMIAKAHSIAEQWAMLTQSFKSTDEMEKAMSNKDENWSIYDLLR